MAHFPSLVHSFHMLWLPLHSLWNNVFSALLTHWPKVPKTVVYDFVCTLEPYCMTHEHNFFADTLFIIDSFHAKSHTKCTPAAFLSTYANMDPCLTCINSSVAECGNGRLNCICKSVSTIFLPTHCSSLTHFMPKVIPIAHLLPFFQHTITATAMQKPILMQNAMLTLFIPSFLPWDFCVS
jgi:hypothetical protein